AEACAGDFYTALDKALDKLNRRMRKAADRRRVHRGRPPVSVAEATAPLAKVDAAFERQAAAVGVKERTAEEQPAEEQYEDDQPWRIVRMKEHPAEPMTVEDALFQMELVGHDFYLFMDKDSGRPSVVYRRKGYDYGVISLATT
ncbi:MAG TPA: HPF/RaiA family ribosome-associated protein, partial [Micromonosporaceae bacterium]|nr:HPF/RaiA family ribosome-associated protein [Micromonosporaceae bacterium]